MLEIERTDIMLKLKDSVDLKELEKYGFKKNRNSVKVDMKLSQAINKQVEELNWK